MPREPTKKTRRFALCLIVAGLLLAGAFTLSALFSKGSQSHERGTRPQAIRIGWQLPAATQAQIVQVLKRTNVLELQGLEPRLVPFSFGSPEIEAALAGGLDVVFAGDQPVINLISRGGHFKIVARLFYDRIAIMVPPASPVQSIEDLRGKVVASPFGSNGHRVVILEQEAAGLDVNADVEQRNLDILEIRRLVQSGGVEAWGDVAAVGVWEPTASLFESKRLARDLGSSRALGVVAISDDFIADHPEASVEFLVGLLRAWYFFAENAERVRRWYVNDSQLGFSDQVLEAAAKVDPNVSAQSLGDIDLRLTDELVGDLERDADWAREHGYVKGDFEIRDAVDHHLLAEATKKIEAGALADIKVIMPSASEGGKRARATIYFFDRIPLWSMFILMIGVSFLAIEGGQRLGRRNRAEEAEIEGPVGTVVGAVLALLAFVIALTFSAAGNRFDDRKGALLDEVNAIGTAYLRAGLLREPEKTTTQSLLRDYVEIRLGMYRDYDDLDRLQTIQGRTAALQESIWDHADVLLREDPHSQTYALLTDSLNQVFDLNTTRVVLGAQYRIPPFVWLALGLVSCVAMVAVGFHFGIGGRRSLAASLSLSVTFALVILLIVDLDRPGEGLIEVNQQPMIDLYQSLSLAT